jgi:hypothetical protein
MIQSGTQGTFWYLVEPDYSKPYKIVSKQIIHRTRSTATWPTAFPTPPPFCLLPQPWEVMKVRVPFATIRALWERSATGVALRRNKGLEPAACAISVVSSVSLAQTAVCTKNSKTKFHTLLRVRVLVGLAVLVVL